MLWKQKTQYQAIPIELPNNATAKQIALIANIKAIEQRLLKTPTWSMQEIVALLEGARDAAIQGNDIEVANGLFEQANQLFHSDAQTRNRNWYVFAMLLGVIIVAAVGGVVAYLATLKVPNLKNLAESSTIVSLFSFAAMGSVTSILTRLSSLDLREETSRKFVFYSAIARPFVAISFASVIYVILKYKIIAIQLGDGESQDAVFWIAAFLCGFSERFASDILDRILVPAKE